MRPWIALEEVVETLKGLEGRDAYSSVIKAAEAASSGNERAFLELVRFCRGNHNNTELQNFIQTVLPNCKYVQNIREKFECSRVCHTCEAFDLSLDLLCELSRTDYWPAQFRLGYLFATHEAYLDVDNKALDLLVTSSRDGPVDGSFYYHVVKGKRDQFPLNVFHKIRALALLPWMLSRIDSPGEPDDLSQISS